MIRLILADDHPVFRSGLRAVLAAEPDSTSTAVAATGRDALAAAATEHRPDVAVLDISDARAATGCRCRAQMRAAGLPTRVLVLTMFDDDENVLAAMRAGAYGYALKGAGPDEIRRRGPRRGAGRGRLRRGHRRPDAASTSRASAAAAPFPQLTEREHEVLRLIAGGADNATVARRLASAPRRYATTSPTSSPSSRSPTGPGRSSGPATRDWEGTRPRPADAPRRTRANARPTRDNVP